MKRFFAGCLALVLILSLLPGAALGTEAEPQALTQEAEEPDLPDAPVPSEDLEEVSLLDDSGGTVRGTVSLPQDSAAQADGYLTVALYTAAVLNEDGRVLEEVRLAKSVLVSFTTGESSHAFEISGVPAGSYILRTYSYLCQADVLGGIAYYSADGSAAANAYAPEPLTVKDGSDVTVNLTLPAATCSISGTLTFDQPAAADTNILLYADNNIGTTQKRYAGRLTVKAGDDHADFSIGVTPGNYTLQFNTQQQDSALYCGVNGILTSSYSQYMFYSTYQGPVSGILQDGSALLGTSVAEEDASSPEEAPVSLTGVVTMDDPAADETPAIEGTFSLPGESAAPAGGLVVRLYAGSESAVYYIPEGQHSFHYAMYNPVTSDIFVYAMIDEAPAEIHWMTCPITVSSATSSLNLTASEAVTISGSLTVPDTCREGAATFSIVARYTWDSTITDTVSAQASVLPGETSIPYSIQVPKGAVLNRLSVYLMADSQNLLYEKSIYLQSDGTTSNSSASLSWPVTEDQTVNFSIPTGIFLTGALSLAPGLEEGVYRGLIQAERTDGSKSFSYSFNFNGSSCDYRISLSEDDIGVYDISVYIVEGAGVSLYTNFYYSEDGMTSDKTAATPVSIGAEGCVRDLTIPKAKVISGQLVSTDGGSIQWDPSASMTAGVFQNGTLVTSYPMTVDSQGNWSFQADPGLTGDYQLRFGFSSSIDTNIFCQYYFYAPDGMVTEQSDAGTLSIGAEDVTDLKLYVETGWILSGDILFPENGYLTGGTVSVSLRAQDADNNYTRGTGTIGENGGSYRILVPKEESTYTITLTQPTIPSGISSNLYIDNQTLSGIQVSGDTYDLNFTLKLAKAVISGTIYRPEGVTGFIPVSISLYGGINSYQTTAYLSSGGSSTSFSIAIPDTETNATYQLYYILYDAVAGAVSQKFIYLCSDGSLTTNYAQAGAFPFAENQSFSFTLLTVEPFATGRIYCPEGLTEKVTVNVGYEAVSEVSLLDRFDVFAVDVGPGIGQQDLDGRWYSTYSLGDTAMVAGSKYNLIYCVDAPNDTVDAVYYHFVNPDGTIGNWSEGTYTVPSSGSNIVDFTPLLWDDGSEDFILQSPHGIDSNLGPVTYTYTFPEEVDTLTVRFSKRTDVNLTINGQPYYAYSLARGSAVTLESNTLTITMTPTNASSLPAYGFAVTNITATSHGEPVGPAAAVYTEAGGTDEAILSALNKGQPVRASLVSKNMDEAATLTGVIYDADGKMLELVQIPVDLSSGSAVASLQFTKTGAATLKLLLTDGDWIPLMQNLVYQEAA